MTSTRRAIVRIPRTSGAFAGATGAALAAAGLLALACSTSAIAGFVDERPATPPPAAVTAPAAAAAVATPVSAGSASTPTAADGSSKPVTTAGSDKSLGGAGAVAPLTALPTAVVAAPVAAPAAVSFTVSREDKTIREALVRWSHQAGWTNDPENWTVNFDLPVLSSANLGTDYKTAVRALLSSTDLTNLPLQPCFYSNNVLRVVPKAELCDKTAAAAN